MLICISILFSEIFKNKLVSISILISFTISAKCQSVDSFIVLNKSKIYYHKTGEQNPSVIFVSGLGESSGTWRTIQDSISRFALTISYDRAGLGKSDYNGEKKDLTSMAMELRRVLRLSKIPEPYLLIGHSLGCQVIKKYTSLFSKSVCGIVFIDPGYNEETLKSKMGDSVWRIREIALKKYLPAFSKAQQAELDNLNTICRSADKIIRLPEVPVVLFTATQTNPDFPGSTVELKVKQEAHLQWLKTIPQAKHIEVKESRHYVHNDVPVAIITSIREMARAIQK